MGKMNVKIVVEQTVMLTSSSKVTKQQPWKFRPSLGEVRRRRRAVRKTAGSPHNPGRPASPPAAVASANGSPIRVGLTNRRPRRSGGV